jgi:hypothetical protein
LSVGFFKLKEGVEYGRTRRVGRGADEVFVGFGEEGLVPFKRSGMWEIWLDCLSL